MTKVKPILTKTSAPAELLMDVDFLESLNSKNPLEQAVAIKHFVEKALDNAEDVFNEIREKHGRLDVEALTAVFTFCVESANSTQNSEPAPETK